MKRRLIPLGICLTMATLLSGCVLTFSFGGGKKDSTNSMTSSNSTSTANTTSNNNDQHPAVQQTVNPTIGQQLIDLKKAKDSGAITDAEYEAEKAKLLNGNK